MAGRPIFLPGLIVSGAGEGAFFVELQWVRAAVERAVGFVPYPGTLNVRLVDDAALARWREVRARGGVRLAPPARSVETIDRRPGDRLTISQRPGPRDIDAAPGVCGGRLIPALVDDTIAGAVVVPDITRHADDVLEVLAPVHLRTLLRRMDGDPVTLTIDGHRASSS
jgi:riboflavin kinase, archaea type